MLASVNTVNSEWVFSSLLFVLFLFLLQTPCSCVRSQVVLSEGSRSPTSDCITELCSRPPPEKGQCGLWDKVNA